MTQQNLSQNVSAEPPVDVTVLIAGAGPVGLTASILLSRLGIDNMVAEKRGQVSTLPRARGLTGRTIEILYQMGLGEQVEQIALREPWIDYVVYTETITGELVGKMENVMKRGTLAAISPVDNKLAAQDRIDPMLYDAARSYPEAEVHFNTEVIGFEDGPVMTVTLRDQASGATRTVRCRYLVAADGGRSPLRELAGIERTGAANLRSFVNNYVRADISRYLGDRHGGLIWTLKPGCEGLLQIIDGEDRWGLQIQFDPETDDVDNWTPERTIAKTRAILGIGPGDPLDMEIFRTYPFTISTMVAKQFRKGRLLLTGDAAHQVPPYGGFGLNSGIQSAHNLVWKLAAVLRGEAPEALLDNYDSERQELIERVLKFGRINANYLEQLMGAVRAATTLKEKRTLVESTRQYGNWTGLDLGMHYDQGAFVADAVEPPAVENPVIDFVPHAKPGYRAPHLWVRHQGERTSTIFLCAERFILLCGPQGQAWTQAARQLAAGVQPAIAAYRVAPDGDLEPEQDFCALYGIEPDGAVLVRPDGHVGYRAPRAVEDPVAALRSALDQCLCRA